MSHHNFISGETMNQQEFKSTVERIITNDSRYTTEAYEFIGEAVNFTAAKLKKNRLNPKTRHITCLELLYGVSEFAIKQFGPMAGDIFETWGLRSSQAIGDVVFNMINEQLLSASENDSLEQFSRGASFYELFRKPFLPTRNVVAPILDL